ncbi:MAG TPA: acetylxylan esterase [Cytophagaceae bacterium]
MKNRILTTVFSLLIGFTLLSASAQNKTNKISFDDQWKFHEGDDKSWSSPTFNDSKWTFISSKKVIEEQGYPTFDGLGWYRRSIILPETLKNAAPGDLIISFNQVDDADEAYFNGHLIGSTGGFPPNYESKYSEVREYLVPSKYVYLDKPNTIAIRVFDGGGSGGLVSPTLDVRAATQFDRLKISVAVADEDKIFLGSQPQKVDVTVKNLNSASVLAKLHVDITTDDHQKLKSFVENLSLQPGQNLLKSIAYPAPSPGFYRYSIYLESNGSTGSPKKFNLGYEPEKINAPIDSKPDFKSFWENNLKELALVTPDFQMTSHPEYSNKSYEVFEVAMNSFGSVRVKGYYCKPKKEGKFPVSVEYQGYGSGFSEPDTTWDGFAHMKMSIRGQGYNIPGNIYGDWIVYGLENKENYYYRGAYLDIIRGIDFVCTRAEVDTSKIVTMGGSQGGALTFVSAALDKRVKACAPTIPFLSDYRNYFKIAPWPASSFESYLKQHPERTWDQAYEVLTYFDIKNFAPWIKCPLFMGIGVQDEVCPPHINFAAYNNVKGKKRWIAYGDQQHSVGQDYYKQRQQFFKSILKLD